MAQRIGWLLDEAWLKGEPLALGILTALAQTGCPVQILDRSNRLAARIKWECKDVDMVTLIGTIDMNRRIGQRYIGPPLHALFTPELHYYSRYQHLLHHADLLNIDGVMLPMSEIRRQQPASLIRHACPRLGWFIKPDQSLKVCESKAVPLGGAGAELIWLTEWGNDMTQRHSATDTTLFWLFRAQHVKAEYRFIVVEGCVVAASQYIREGAIALKAGAAADAVALAERTAGYLKLSDPAWVLDIADTAEGPKVIELNCLSSSGMYHCAPDKTIPALHRALQAVAQEFAE